MSQAKLQCQEMWQDLKQGVCKYPLWCYLAWNDIRFRYRRSVIGPWWITISMLISVVAIGVVYSRVLHQPLKTYLPYLVCGMTIWSFISANISESGEVFKLASNYIRQIKLPFIIYVLRQMLRNLIIFSHNLLVYVGVVVFFSLNPGWHLLYIIPGFILVILCVTPGVLLLGMLSTRYRDIAQIITNLTTLLFFVSPITWQTSLLGTNSCILLFNPIYYLLDITRDPLLGQSPVWFSWWVVSAMAVVMWVLALWVFAKGRDHIAFWVD